MTMASRWRFQQPDSMMNYMGFPIYDQTIAQPKATKKSRTQPQQLVGNPVVVKSEPIDENEHPEQLLGNIVVFSATTHIDMLHHLRAGRSMSIRRKSYSEILLLLRARTHIWHHLRVWSIDDDDEPEQLLGNFVIVMCDDTYCII